MAVWSCWGGAAGEALEPDVESAQSGMVGGGWWLKVERLPFGVDFCGW